MRRALPVVAVVGLLVVGVGAAMLAGITVDRNRTEDLRELLREADRVATQPPSDDPLEYFVVHNQLAAAAGVESCSEFAMRMTQRFFPEGWHFREQDVEAVKAGGEVPEIHVVTGEEVDTSWQC